MWTSVVVHTLITGPSLGLSLLPCVKLSGCSITGDPFSSTYAAYDLLYMTTYFYAVLVVGYFLHIVYT